MNSKNKKASIQLSMNFLVILIVCIVLLGIGIGLMAKGQEVAEKWENSVSHNHEERLVSLLNDGSLVSVYPRSLTVEKGDLARYALGINNELGKEQEFSIHVELSNSDVNSEMGAAPKELFLPGPYRLKNNEQITNIAIGIDLPRETASGEWVFNVYVCKGESCSPSVWSQEDKRYGRLQKIQVNVR